MLFNNNDLYITSLGVPYDYYSTYGANGGYSSNSVNTITTYGGGGSSGIATGSASQNVYSITGLTATGSTGNMGISLSTGGWATSSASIYGTYPPQDSDILLKRNGKPELKIGATLDLIMESLYIIIPDKNDLENNPALKSAYEHWQEKFNEHKKLMSPVKEAYDSYVMMQKLVKEETEE